MFLSIYIRIISFLFFWLNSINKKACTSQCSHIFKGHMLCLKIGIEKIYLIQFVRKFCPIRLVENNNNNNNNNYHLYMQGSIIDR
jgi:hypothetical protein